MTIYEYIARNNPTGAKRVIESFGYVVTQPKKMGDNLRMLVAQEGEPALKAVVDLHPDKDLILEVFGNSQGFKGTGDNFFGADGLLQSAVLNNNQQQNDSNNKMVLQTNTLIVALSLLVVAGLILKNR
jgi:hypothetical protein